MKLETISKQLEVGQLKSKGECIQTKLRLINEQVKYFGAYTQQQRPLYKSYTNNLYDSVNYWSNRYEAPPVPPEPRIPENAEDMFELFMKNMENQTNTLKEDRERMKKRVYQSFTSYIRSYCNTNIGGCSAFE